MLLVSAQWRVGVRLINSEKENGADIPSKDWLYEDGDGTLQNDETLTIKSNLLILMVISTQCTIMKEVIYQFTMINYLYGFW